MIASEIGVNMEKLIYSVYDMDYWRALANTALSPRGSYLP